MSKKKYTVTTVDRTAQPRSKRRQGASSSGGGSSVVINGQSDSGAAESADLAAQAHSHGNKPLLDSLSDSDGYLLLRQKAEDADDSERGKVKAGYADEAKTLSQDSDIWGKFLRKDADDTANGRIKFKQGIGIGDEYEITSDGRALLNSVGSSRFVSGFLGSGFRAWLENQVSKFEVDELTVRRVMNVAELLIHKIRAVGGEVIVSAADGKIAKVNGSIITLEDADGNGMGMFQVGDYIRCQRWDTSLNRIYGYWLQVTAKSGLNLTLDISGREDGMQDTPHAGDEIVLLGSTTSGRQGAVLISATEGGVPVVDVLDGINSPSLAETLRARFGGLDGISDSAFGDNQPQGYGLFANNAYLKGVLVLANGEDVGSKFSVLEDRVQSVVTGIAEEDNLLLNPTFDGYAHWTLTRLANTPSVPSLYMVNDNNTSFMFRDENIMMTGIGTKGSQITTKDGARCLLLAHYDEISQTLDQSVDLSFDTLKINLNVFCSEGVAISVENGNFEDTAYAGKDGWQTISFEIVTDQSRPAFGRTFTFSADEDVYFAYMWLGVNVESKIAQSASNIELSITQGLNRTGIDIEKNKITLTAQTTEVSNDLVVGSLMTRDEQDGAKIEIKDGLLKVFGSNGVANIKFGLDENGYAILQYFDKNGVLLYDLGVNGLGQLQSREENFVSTSYYDTKTLTTSITLHRYYAKIALGQITSGTITTTPANAKEANGLLFTSQTIEDNGAIINKASGNYWLPVERTYRTFASIDGEFPETQSDGTAWDLTPDPNNEEVLLHEIYRQPKVTITNGVDVVEDYYWQDTNN